MNYSDLYPVAVRPITNADRTRAMNRHTAAAPTPLSRAAYAQLHQLLSNHERSEFLIQLDQDTAAAFRNALRSWGHRMDTALRRLISSAADAESRR